MASPTAKPIPRAPRTAAATPIRTTVLRRIADHLRVPWRDGAQWRSRNRPQPSDPGAPVGPCRPRSFPKSRAWCLRRRPSIRHGRTTVVPGRRAQLPPHPEPGCEAATGAMPPVVVVVVVGRVIEGGVVPPRVVEVVVGGVDDASFEGVTVTSWKMPATSWNTTTIAGALWKPTVTVPVPWPPVAASQTLHVILLTVVTFAAHPTVIVAGRTCGVGPGPQDRTAGIGAAVVEVATEDVVVDARGVVVEASVVAALFGGEVLEPTLNPMAVPTPRAARTSTTTPAWTRVLRRTVTSAGSFFAIATHGTSPRSENDECRLRRSLRFRGRVEPQERTLHGDFPCGGEGHSARSGSRSTDQFPSRDDVGARVPDDVTRASPSASRVPAHCASPSMAKLACLWWGRPGAAGFSGPPARRLAHPDLGVADSGTRYDCGDALGADRRRATR